MELTAARPRKMWGVTDQPSMNLYVPMVAVIDKIIDETPDSKTFRLRFEDKEYARSFKWEPGQFVEVTVFGAGEAPIGFASNPSEKDFFELTVVERGKVTGAMHRLKVGDKVGVRGPLGNCWPLEDVRGQDIVIVGGGCGLAPLRPAIYRILEDRASYGDFWLLYGARTPADRNFKYDLELWSVRDDMHLLETVDVPDDTWNEEIGVVTVLFEKMRINPSKAVAFTCGPPIMIKFATIALLKMGFSEDRIVMSLERYMKCGVGKCGHCCVNHVYLCTEGPVFTYKELLSLPELNL
ncbi:MAG: FAD/NAD(P)-binding protein [Armatimonadetes bacterium]|nr:FAD/NAD(P)-binding protein [Armatimonadota bacterium]